MSIARLGSSWFYTTCLTTCTGACLGAYNSADVMEESDMSLKKYIDVMHGTMTGARYGCTAGLFAPLQVVFIPCMIIGVTCQKINSNMCKQ
jgi:hypothetical protein